MNDDVYLSFAEAKKYVGRGFSSNFLKTAKNEFGASLGYRVSDLDNFVASRKKSVTNKPKIKFFGLRCTESEFEEIENFKKIYGIGYRELVLRIVRNVNKSPDLFTFFERNLK